MTAHPHRDRSFSLARLALLTVSDTRTENDDASGAEMVRLVEEAGHVVFDRRIVPDEPQQVRRTIETWFSEAGCDGALISGGTGISGRDRTIEAITPLLDRRLEGFGELFRMLSWEEIGSAAMLSRAIGGTVGERLLFALPGSPAAVRLGLERLILPEVGHLLSELRRR